MYTYNVNMPNSAESLGERLTELLRGAKPVFAFIGTQYVLYDKLGPLVGSMVKNSMPTPCYMYGEAGRNIHALNLIEAMRFIRIMHPENKLVVVDAATGHESEVGQIQLFSDGIVPASATNLNLKKVGDIGILGVVIKRGDMGFFSSYSQKAALIDKTAQVIAQGLIRCMLSSI